MALSMRCIAARVQKILPRNPTQTPIVTSMTKGPYLFSRNIFRFQVLPFMDHGQHFDEVVGFDLVENAVGVKPQFAHGVFVEFRYLVAFATQGIQADGFAYQFFTDTLGVERGVQLANGVKANLL